MPIPNKNFNGKVLLSYGYCSEPGKYTPKDLDDVDFIALTKYIKGSLWTGDLELYNGLKLKGFKKVFTTKELVNMRNNKI